MKVEGTRTCLVCGTRFPLAKEFCPVCILREALNEETKADLWPMKQHRDEPKSGRFVERLEHYELASDQNGNPIELGRGAMGVTYKAFDVNLRCPVALKVINEQNLGDDGAQNRFLREARAAASIRHPNVASVLHLGRTKKSYFYAMEFVAGDTLENLIRSSGRLETKLALEIACQLGSGLAGIHKQKLVHRDLKPSNIMMNLEEGGAVAVKIIDLGLAKSSNEIDVKTAISLPGGFVGTPEFASPEQFSGLGVDIRSDIYSLGVILWQMVTGHEVFRGSAAELMYQHQHAPLPLKFLEAVPQPVVALLQVLLEKDPGRRFQNPADFIKAVSTVTSALKEPCSITRQSLHDLATPASRAVCRKRRARVGPEKISVARLPVTGGDIFGREEDIAFLDAAWVNRHINVVTIVAWAGVGKSALVNHWLGRMASKQYRNAQLVFGWSFYRQGSSGSTSSADEFVDSALTWFEDPKPTIGTAWEKGERLAKLVKHRRTLLILDGLEPLQNPPGPQEGRLREPALQSLLRELAAFNTGLCVITTRSPVPDLAVHEPSSALRRDLEHLSSEAGATLLRALGVKGDEEKVRSASEEFSGHCLALTLLGSFLSDAYNGDIRRRKEVSERLACDVRQGVHARKVMESYQTWFGPGPELSVLRILGLFDRPASERSLGAVLKPPAIPGLTESLTDLSPAGWQLIVSKLRRARLLAGEDPSNPGHLDTHPLVREYFGEQLRNQKDAWQESNRRLFNDYRSSAPQLPNSFKEMEPLFLAAICGCNAGLFREALHEIYIPRIQRGDASFSANVLGARTVLLSVLAHFFERPDWKSPFPTGSQGQSLTAEDQLFVLTQAGLFLTVTRGMGAEEARLCYERAEHLCHSLNRPLLLYLALMGQWRYSLLTNKLSETMEIAKRVHSMAHEQHEAALLMGAHRALAGTFFFYGDFESAQHNAIRSLQIWRSGGGHLLFEEVVPSPVASHAYLALSEWHLGEISSCRANMAKAISLAKELNDMQALTLALYYAAIMAHFEGDPVKVERCSSDLIELSTLQNYGSWQHGGSILRFWARGTSRELADAVSCIQNEIEDYLATGRTLVMPYYLALKAEALHLANRPSEALEAIAEAESLVEASEERWWSAELLRLRGVFLIAVGAHDSSIEFSLRQAVSVARQQKSISLANRAEETLAEYHGKKG
jgi:hypothetical protein